MHPHSSPAQTTIRSDGAGVAASSGDATVTVAKRLWRHITCLLEAYGAFGAQETQRTVRGLAFGAALIGGAAVMAVYAVGLGLAAAVLALSRLIVPWLDALIVLAIVVFTMVVLIVLGVRRLNIAPMARVFRQFQEDARWLSSEIFGRK